MFPSPSTKNKRVEPEIKKNESTREEGTSIYRYMKKEIEKKTVRLRITDGIWSSAVRVSLFLFIFFFWLSPHLFPLFILQPSRRVSSGRHCKRPAVCTLIRTFLFFALSLIHSRFKGLREEQLKSVLRSHRRKRIFSVSSGQGNGAHGSQLMIDVDIDDR